MNHEVAGTKKSRPIKFCYTLAVEFFNKNILHPFFIFFKKLPQMSQLKFKKIEFLFDFGKKFFFVDKNGFCLMLPKS